MNYTLLPTEKATQIRERFEAAFIKDFSRHAEENSSDYRYTNPTIMYSALFRDDVVRLDFYEALGELTKVTNEIYFLNDRCPLGESCVLNMPFVAATDNIKSFAKQIFDEWCREFYLGSYIFSDYFHKKTNNLFKDKMFRNVLPFDIYIFDESMEWMLAFTHEDCEDESEYDEDARAVEPRRCCYLIRRKENDA